MTAAQLAAGLLLLPLPLALPLAVRVAPEQTPRRVFPVLLLQVQAAAEVAPAVQVSWQWISLQAAATQMALAQP